MVFCPISSCVRDAVHANRVMPKAIQHQLHRAGSYSIIKVS